MIFLSIYVGNVGACSTDRYKRETVHATFKPTLMSGSYTIYIYIYINTHTVYMYTPKLIV